MLLQIMQLISKNSKYFLNVTGSQSSFIFIILIGLFVKYSKSENFFIGETGIITHEREINNENRYFYDRNLPEHSKLLSLRSTFDKLKSENDKIDLNQFILFNIDDKVTFEPDYPAPVTSLHKQPLNQTTVNYCDFDPNLKSSKRHVSPSKLNSDRMKQNVDIIVKGRIFDKSSQISVRIQFQNEQAQSQQLWYLLEAKSVCTDNVIGTWRLNKDSNTETIYCFNRDDTVFGHRNNQNTAIFDQIWIPTKTYEDIYFVLAIFTDEAYSVIDPYYSIISSPIILYESYSLIDDYNIKCRISRVFNNNSSDVFMFEPTDRNKDLQTELTDKTADTTLNTRDLNSANENINFVTMSFAPEMTSTTTTINSITDVYAKDRSILISLVAKLPDCSKLNTNLAIVIKNELEMLYKNVSDFDQVEIIQITSTNCGSSVRKIRKRQASSPPDVTIQHYCLFKQPVNNRIKLNILNILQDSVSTSQQMGGLSTSEVFILNKNNDRIYLNQRCLVYDYLEICQNNAVCQINKNSMPICVCPGKVAGQNFYWSGDYCDVKVTDQKTTDLIKMYVTIGVLATFAIASILALVLYIVYKRRKQREIIKRVLSDKSKSSGLRTLSSPNYIDYPRINGHTDPHLRTIAYPRDVVISSSPKNHFKNIFRQQPNSKKSKSKTDKNVKKDNRTKNLKSPVIILDKEYTNEKNKQQQNNSHVNYAYDSEIMFSTPAQIVQSENVKSEKSSKIQPFFWKAEHSQEELFQQNIHTHSDEFLIESQMHKNNIKIGRKDSALHIPQSFERNMVKNLKNLTTNSSPSGTYSLDTSIENSINQNSKYTDSTSICTDHSLKDEDAWLPILNIAEEETLKYQAEEANQQTEYCLI